MVRRNISIGARSFDIAGVTIGTARRVPAALKLATDILKRSSQDTDGTRALSPTVEELNAMIELIHDGITVAAKGSGVPAPTIEDLVALFDEESITAGLTQMYRAVGAMFEQDGKPEPTKGDGATSGNSISSESAS